MNITYLAVEIVSLAKCIAYLSSALDSFLSLA